MKLRILIFIFSIFIIQNLFAGATTSGTVKATRGEFSDTTNASLVAGGDVYLSTTSGKVGIGTTAPTSKFEILNGSVTIQGTGAGLRLGNLTSGFVKADANGNLSSGSIASGDVPNLDTSKLTSGTLVVARGGTGTSTAFTQGSVIFAGASGFYSQNNSGLFWDNTNARLGVGTASPTSKFEILNGSITVSGTNSGLRVASGNVIFGGLSTAGFVKNSASGLLSTASQVNLASEVTGTLPVANGGTGATSVTANYIFAAPNGSTGAPSFRLMVSADVPSLDTSKITTGEFAHARVSQMISKDTRGNNYEPQSYNPALQADFKSNTTDGLSDGGTYHGVLSFRPYGSGGDFTGGPMFHLGFTNNNNIYIRKSTSTTGWSTWNKIWHDGNLTGTQNYVARWATANTMGIGVLYDNGTNVGIGTTSPGQKIEIIGVNSAPGTSGTVADGIARFHPTGSAAVLDIGYLSSPANAWLQSRDSGNYATNYSLSLNPNGGNVGIGTTNPSYLLDVESSSFGGNSIVAIEAQSSAPTTSFIGQRRARGSLSAKSDINAGDQLGSYNTYGYKDSEFRRGGAMPFYADEVGTGYINTSIRFLTSYNSDSFQERMRITSSGNVGIGTTNPDHLLQLTRSHDSGTTADMFRVNFDANWGLRLQQNYTGSGNIQYDFIERYSSTDYNVLTFKGGNVGVGTTNPQCKLDVRLSGNGSTGTYFFIGGSQTYHMLGISEDTTNNGIIFDNTYQGATYFAFRTSNGSSLTERMRIHTNGNVGIGTTNPTGKLHVVGDVVGKAQVFQARFSGNYSHPGGSWQKLPFNTIVFNTLSGSFDTGIYRFTPSRAGYYQVSVTGYSGTSSSGCERYAIGIYKNATCYAFTGGNFTSTGDTPLGGFTGIVYLNGTTDYLEIYAFSAIAAVFNGPGGAGHEMFWFMNYLGE